MLFHRENKENNLNTPCHSPCELAMMKDCDIQTVFLSSNLLIIVICWFQRPIKKQNPISRSEKQGFIIEDLCIFLVDVSCQNPAETIRYFLSRIWVILSKLLLLCCLPQHFLLFGTATAELYQTAHISYAFPGGKGLSNYMNLFTLPP